MIHDLNGKPRGYAFIEYNDKAEMSSQFCPTQLFPRTYMHFTQDLSWWPPKARWDCGVGADLTTA